MLPGVEKNLGIHKHDNGIRCYSQGIPIATDLVCRVMNLDPKLKGCKGYKKDKKTAIHLDPIHWRRH